MQICQQTCLKQDNIQKINQKYTKYIQKTEPESGLQAERREPQ